MEYRHLGRSGLVVRPLCLGTMNFGGQSAEPDSHAIMDRALARIIQRRRSHRVAGLAAGWIGARARENASGRTMHAQRPLPPTKMRVKSGAEGG